MVHPPPHFFFRNDLTQCLLIIIIIFIMSEIKDLLSIIGLTQKELSKRIDITERSISRWCTGSISTPMVVLEYLRLLERSLK